MSDARETPAVLARPAVGPAVDVECDALVVGVVAGVDGPCRRLATDDESARVLQRLLLAAPDLRLDGTPGRCRLVPSPPGVRARCVLLVDLGQVTDDLDEAVAATAAEAFRSVRHLPRTVFAAEVGSATGLDRLVRMIVLGTHDPSGAVADPARTLGELAADLAPEGPTVVVRFAPSLAREAATQAALRARVVSHAVIGARELVESPPNRCTPDSMGRLAEELALAAGLDVDRWELERLRREGLGGLVGVGEGASSPPCLVVLRHRPPGAVAHVGIAGKGVTFDSGGLNLKRSGDLWTMKTDMAGAAAALYACLAAAALELPVAVTAWLPLAENAVSSRSMRPGDVLRLRDGRSVEVRDTDLEGRLLLADALALASETGPDVLIDVATLTEAQGLALGPWTSALLSNDDRLSARLLEAAEAVGEPLWRLPLLTHLREALASSVADLANEGAPTGTTLTAALFLEQFASPASAPVPWAHLDICSTAYNRGPAHGAVPHGATGVAVQTLVELMSRLPGADR